MKLLYFIKQFFSLLIISLFCTTIVFAQANNSISKKDSTTGIREALSLGVNYAVGELAKENGFLGNDKVKIGLPGGLDKIAQALSAFGKDKPIKTLELTMNRAAEQAIVEAKPILVKAIKSMSIKDASQIIFGKENSATEYFRQKSSGEIASKFLPIVQKNTAKLKLAEQYSGVISAASALGLVKDDATSLDQYVTKRAVDGLFVMIAEEEKKIRENPLETGSKILAKIFGRK